jgi:hypothetical protein
MTTGASGSSARAGAAAAQSSRSKTPSAHLRLSGTSSVGNPTSRWPASAAWTSARNRCQRPRRAPRSPFRSQLRSAAGSMPAARDASRREPPAARIARIRCMLARVHRSGVHPLGGGPEGVGVEHIDRAAMACPLHRWSLSLVALAIIVTDEHLRGYSPKD